MSVRPLFVTYLLRYTNKQTIIVVTNKTAAAATPAISPMFGEFPAGSVTTSGSLAAVVGIGRGSAATIQKGAKTVEIFGRFTPQINV